MFDKKIGDTNGYAEICFEEFKQMMVSQTFTKQACVLVY
jgi:hypothetical protein